MARRQARNKGAKAPVRYTEALLAVESSVQGDTPVHRIMSVVGVGSVASGVGGTIHEAKATRLVIAINAWHTDTFRPHLQFHLLDRAIIYDWDQSREWNVLIGMDVITRGDFEFVSDRAGRRVVVWRSPSRRRMIKYPQTRP